jgi:hypothetical protein
MIGFLAITPPSVLNILYSTKEVMQYKKYESGQGASDGDDAPKPSFAGRTRKKTPNHGGLAAHYFWA